jgi:hypothetical protein
MCKEMPVISVNRVVDMKKWRAEEEERHKGLLTPPPPQKKKSLASCNVDRRFLELVMDELQIKFKNIQVITLDPGFLS